MTLKVSSANNEEPQTKTLRVLILDISQCNQSRANAEDKNCLLKAVKKISKLFLSKYRKRRV
jgi:hypothetical protein